MPSGGGHHHPQPRVVITRDAITSQIPELSLSGLGRALLAPRGHRSIKVGASHVSHEE